MAIATAWIAAVGAATAAAGSYTVVSCDAALGAGFSSAAWVPEGTAGQAYAACPSQGGPTSGISNRITNITVGAFGFSRHVFSAPAGTTITGIRWSGRLARGACYWGVTMRAEPSGSTIFGLPNGSYCSTPEFDLRTSSLTFTAPPGTTQLQQLVICGVLTCERGATMHTVASVVTIDDPQPPTLSFSGPLVERRWVSGTPELAVHAQDNAGIAGYSARLGAATDSKSLPCNYAAASPCPDRTIIPDLSTLENSQGPNQLIVDVLDAAGNPGRAVQTVRVDNEPPERVQPQVVNGEAWRRTNGFRLSWATPVQAYAPIVRAHYRLCGPGGCTTDVANTPNAEAIGPFNLKEPGDYTVQVWLEDEAGNESYALTASDPVHLRFDPDAPTLAFDPADPADPLRVSVNVADSQSGVANGEIEMRRRGGDAWHALDTAIQGTRLVGFVDDERFRDGAFEFRAHATDAAGNEGSTDRRADGARATIDLPVRFATHLRVGLRRAVHRRHRPRTRLVSRARIRLGRQVRLQGRLVNADGQPLDAATVEVLSDTANDSAGWVSSGIAHTDSKGRFTYVARANRSKTLRFRYGGSRRIHPAETDFRLGVPAASTIRARPRGLLNGETVTLTGRVRTSPLPPAGKLIEIQAFFRGRWRTFSTTRAAPDGRWRFEYQFDGTRGRLWYRLRARLPAEGGYPFDTGRSPVARVLVTGL